MKTKMCVLIFLLAAAFAWAQTNNLTALLQSGLFEEQANHNLDAAIADYTSLATQFDKDRQLAATAVFRIGECYRAQGKTNEAAAQYQRVLRDFSDEQTLATLSRQDLVGMGMTQPDSGKASERKGDAWVETSSLATQISGIEGLKSDLEEQARAVQAIFPDEELKNMLLQLPKLQKQEADFKANPQLIVTYEMNGFEAFTAIGSKKITHWGDATNLLAEFQRQTFDQTAQIQQRVNFILEIQKARLKVLQSAEGFAAGPNAARNDTATVVIDEEDQEIQRIQQMIQNSPDLINASGENGNTPLTQAAYKGWLKVAAYLLDHGADVNGGSIPPLNAGATAGNRAMVELLLSRGANVNSKGGQEKTPLYTAVEKKFPAVIEVLLANKADGNTPDFSGTTPLDLAAQSGQVKIVQSLLAAGANVNAAGDTLRSPLSFAAHGGSPEIVKMLLAAKADPNGGNLDAPLLVAINNKDAMSVELLLQAGANPNAKGAVNWDIFINGSSHWAAGHPSETPLFLAVSTKQLLMVQLLLKLKADPNDSQTDGQPLLFSALDQPDILAALLDAGGKVDARTSQGELLLNNAIAGKNTASVEVLLKHGANPNAPGVQGHTPLHYAAAYVADDKIFQLLFDYKANPNVRNDQGTTPLDLLKERLRGASLDSTARVKISGLVDLLHQHGALDKLPDWDRITVSRPSANFSEVVFQKGTNDWNQFTLLETICAFDQNDNRPNNPLAFADLAHIVIVRPSAGGATSKRIEVNLLNATDGVDCAKDIPLEFGDVVEIPEREHTLAEPAIYLPKDQFMTIYNYLRNKTGSAKLIVAGGEMVQLPLELFFSKIGEAMLGNAARGVLTSSSDLSRVKVTRRDAKTGKNHEWIVDCSEHQLSANGNLEINNNGFSGGTISIAVTPISNGNNPQPSSDLWLRDGDVIEVPEKP